MGIEFKWPDTTEWLTLAGGFFLACWLYLASPTVVLDTVPTLSLSLFGLAVIHRLSDIKDVLKTKSLV